MNVTRWVIVVIGLGVAAGVFIWRSADALVEQRLRPATVRLLEERFNSHVQIERLVVKVFPGVSVRGEGLVMRHRDRPDVPPLITIKAFTIEAGIRELWTRRIDRVHLQGLHLIIPPRRGADMPSPAKREGGDERSSMADVTIRELVSDDGLLTIASKRPDKAPREFQLTRLRFEELRFDRPTAYQAELSNPVPQGLIHTAGTFGPWNGDEPSATPITGNFKFDADLGSIDGIGGDLHAEGTFGGPLDRIQTEGRTRTPNFHLSSGGAEFPLLVSYKATVDGTSGDTFLDAVEAELGKSHISASGAIHKLEGAKGKRIALDTSARGGRIEEFVRLTTRVRSSPISGDVDVTAKLEILPGEPEIIDRMTLEGKFALASAQFASDSVQTKVDELSRRGSGKPTADVDDVASNMRGVFALRSGVMRLHTLTFSVEGAEVRLAGAYGVKSEELDFRGQLRLKASVSQTQTGWRSLVLKPFDPLFKRDGAGTLLPITITGTRSQPKFGVEMKKAVMRQ
jgi:hypothetical protein